jgi:methylated-DNA-[protein]-cysteine S-methyltransferase
MPQNPVSTAHLESPAGWIRIEGNGAGLSGLVFCEKPSEPLPAEGILLECAAELGEYFSGKLKTFTVPVAPEGSAFQLKVWAELIKIPYGHVVTYRDLAVRLGGPTYTRIVGQANGRNPVSIIIPCHRVIGMNGALTGYAGGLWRKRFLLDLEQKGLRPDFRTSLFENNH